MYAPQRHVFSVREYDRMAEYGIVSGRGTALVEGRVVHPSLGEPRRFTVDEYLRMAETGILPPDAAVELLDGEIVDVSPSGSRHAACISRLSALVHSRLRTGEIVRVQLPIRAGEGSLPEPDLAIVRFRDDYYSGAHPDPGDALLVVEVADSSVGFDRMVKSRIYADHGIPAYWLVDLNLDAVVVHGEPAAGAYRARRTARRGQLLSVQAVPGLEFLVEEILG
jgi:Uma2 family endonuclease